MMVPIISTSRITITLDIKQNKINNNEDKKTCGFHLTRSKWDPYPWIGHVQDGSIADLAGLKTGDCLLQIDQIDVVGLKIKEIATLINLKGSPNQIIKLQIWRNNNDNEMENINESDGGAAITGPLPVLMKKFLKAISGVIDSLQCPVCLETVVSSTSQCVHGHILCIECRKKTLRCPICRVRLGQGKCLVADQVYHNIRDVFVQEDENKIGDCDSSVEKISTNISLKQKLFGTISMKTQNINNKQINEKKIADVDDRKNLFVNQRPKSMTLRQLLLGGFNRVLSADNLSHCENFNTKKFDSKNKNPDDFSNSSSQKNYKLTQMDKTKSASTGTLSENDEKSKYHNEYEHYLSIPQIPRWGEHVAGTSTRIIQNNSFLCPLSVTSNCNALITQDKFGKHLEHIHGYKHQIHFYGKRTIIPIPLSFLVNSVCIFHCDQDDELVIFQYEKEVAWMIGTSSVRNINWILNVSTKNNVNLKLQRRVLKINENFTGNIHSPLYRAEFPSFLSLENIHIEIVLLEPNIQIS